MMNFYLSIYDAPKRVHDSAFLIKELRGSKAYYSIRYPHLLSVVYTNSILSDFHCLPLQKCRADEFYDSNWHDK